MYSGSIAKMLKEAGIKEGDFAVVKFGGTIKEGIVMPKDRFSSSETLAIKLSSGYNIGIDISQIESIVKKDLKSHNPLIRPEMLSFDKRMPKVSAILTGGTISSKIDYRTGGVTGLSKAEEILENIPELSGIVNIDCVSPFTKMSEDMDSSDWIKIAELTAKKLNSGSSGVIITHGTDTMHFTSAALSFMLKDLSKPVILTGSQRSSDRSSSDAGMNIICSAHAAASDIAEVGICMHGEMSDSFCLLNRGTKTRKMHTSRRDAFRPVNSLPLAKIWPEGKIEKIDTTHKKRAENEVIADTVFEEKVAIIKAYPGSDPEIIDYYVSRGFRGFVIEGTGLGHVPVSSKKPWIETIKKYSGKIPFVGTAQTIYGSVNTSVYTNLRMLYHYAGAICGHDMLTETAYIKLGWILGHNYDIDEVKRLMLTNIAGELSERELPENFLY